MPIKISETLQSESGVNPIKELVMEVAFYFGHQIPAFCNKVNNVEWTFFPRYFWSIQPFIERQLSKIGILGYSQVERYETFLQLAENSGFFDTSWSTGFLDIYYNLGIIGTILFFMFFTRLLYNTQTAIEINESTEKYRMLHAINVLFIITMFMTPAFFDTTIFFTYFFVSISEIGEVRLEFKTNKSI